MGPKSMPKNKKEPSQEVATAVVSASFQTAINQPLPNLSQLFIFAPVV